jgi:hypothetical protein
MDISRYGYEISLNSLSSLSRHLMQLFKTCKYKVSISISSYKIIFRQFFEEKENIS